MQEVQETKKKKNGFARFMHAVFVSNIGWKIFAIVFGAVVWALAVGL